jgi:L-methionine (R)-S-oxide reductase
MKLTNLELQAARANETFSAVESAELSPPKQSFKDRLRLDSGTTTAGNGVEYCASRQELSCPLQTSKTIWDGATELHSWLEALTKLYCAHSSMESVLQTASRVVVNVLNLEHCSIAWLDENDWTIRIRISHTREGADVAPAQAVRAISNLVKRERPKQSGSARSVYNLGTERDLDHALELTAPLRMHKQIVGYLYGLRGQFSSPQFFETEKSLFVSLSQHISTAIEAQLTREMLDCPYVALVMNAQNEESIASLTPVKQRILTSVKDPEQLARKIARRFFRDLRRAGFETKQVLFVATEIIDSLNEVLRKAKSGR